MRIVVCAKEVLDPDAVNSYAVAGRLEIGEDGKTLTQAAIPSLMNAYDEQAIEAALRLRDAGADCQIDVVTVGQDMSGLLRHAAALGADSTAMINIAPAAGAAAPAVIDAAPAAGDYHVAARLLAAYVRWSGGTDLVLCGRQASDDDQGVVPALMSELLETPIITIARAVELSDGPDAPTVRVTRVTPDGDEVVEAACPALVTISSELGAPRYPTARATMAARKMQPTIVSLDDLGIAAAEREPNVVLSRQFVPEIQGNCEMIAGETPAELAGNLIERLRANQELP